MIKMIKKIKINKINIMLKIYILIEISYFSTKNN